jgi:protein-tyrosine kinase
MSSLIERAAQRLEQLRNTGVDLAAVAERSPELRPPAPPTARESRHVNIDLETLAKAGFVTPGAPRTAITDDFRIIKRPLIANIARTAVPGSARANLIMVTSALAGEGKTFTAINLALSMAAEVDRTVMLVDADVRRPSVLRVLGITPAPGLLDMLTSSAELSDVLLKTNVERLSVLPAGNPHEGATELLASEGMRRLLDDIATRYPDRIVIFDSPPVLLTTESRVLASRVGQIVFVVQADKTLRSDVEHALAALEGCAVNLVLNQVRTGILSESGYGYRYGYGNADDHART